MNTSGPEYKALRKDYPTIVNCLKQAPSDVVSQLIPSGILAEGDLNFFQSQHNDDGEKAKRIVDVVINQVKNDPQVYHTFIAALKAAGDWTRVPVSKLEAAIPSSEAATKQDLLTSKGVQQCTQGCLATPIPLDYPKFSAEERTLEKKNC